MCGCLGYAIQWPCKKVCYKTTVVFKGLFFRFWFFFSADDKTTLRSYNICSWKRLFSCLIRMKSYANWEFDPSVDLIERFLHHNEVSMEEHLISKTKKKKFNPWQWFLKGQWKRFLKDSERSRSNLISLITIAGKYKTVADSSFSGSNFFSRVYNEVWKQKYHTKNDEIFMFFFKKWWKYLLVLSIYNNKFDS